MKARDVEAFLIFVIIQPALLLFGISVFVMGIIQAIWG